MSLCFLVRHASHALLGRTLAGRAPGLSLDATGRAQAEALGERFATAGLAALYTSPLERARETAEPIARCAGLVPLVRPRLGEIDFGEWTGRSFTELARDPRWDFFNQQRARARAPGGESMVEVQARIAAELDELADRHADAHFAVVSHGDVLRAAIVHVLGASLDSLLRFELAPASVSVVELGAHGARLLALNENVRVAPSLASGVRP
jgi:probable phosphomutase (TIGR03848 family)